MQTVPFEDVRGIQFRVETMIVREGRRIGRPRPDADGYYPQLPLAALGIVTRNMSYYEVAPMVTQLTSPTSMINRKLVDGQLFGEWGHPDISGMETAKALERLAHIEDKSLSHHIRDVSTGETLSNGGKLLVGSVRPHGPHAQCLRDSLENPIVNTAFSLRGISSWRLEHGVSRRSMQKLVTFDAVTSGGFEQASKRFVPAVEGFTDTLFVADDCLVELTIDPRLGRAVLTEAATESFTDHELNDIFGTRVIEYRSMALTVVKDTGVVASANPAFARDVYHELFRAR